VSQPLKSHGHKKSIQNFYVETAWKETVWNAFCNFCLSSVKNQSVQRLVDRGSILRGGGAMNVFFSLRHRFQTGSSIGTEGLSPGVWCVKLTTHLHLVLRLRMRGAIPPLTPKSS